MIDLSIAVDTDTPLTHDEVRKYCLDQGTGIYYTSKGREVEESTIDWLLNHPRPHQAREAVRRNLDLPDFDEWQAIESVLLTNAPDCDTSEIIPLATALKINGALWNDLETSPMDFGLSYDQRIKGMYTMSLCFSYTNEAGELTSEAAEVPLAADTIKELNESLESVIWRALGWHPELDNKEIVAHKLICKDGEYIDSDEFTIRTSIVRTGTGRFAEILRDLSSFEIVE